MPRHFQCTACGKCCYGQLPLTYVDALANANRFPLCLVWTPVRAESRDSARVTQLGFTLALRARQTLAILIMPTVYLPGTFACPALGRDNRCTIHDTKPLR